MSARMVEANETRSTGPKWDRFPASLPQIAYVCADGGYLCVSCANGGSGAIAILADNATIGMQRGADPQWVIIGAQVNDHPESCAHCDRTIPTTERQY